MLSSHAAAGFSVPEALEKLLAWFSRIRELEPELGRNPWEEPPVAVLKKGWSAVSKYFSDLFKEGTTIRRSMIKVVLVGQEGAGKTR